MTDGVDQAGHGAPPSSRGEVSLPVVLLAVADDRVPGGRRLRKLAKERRAIKQELAGKAEVESLSDALLREVFDAFHEPPLQGRIEVFHFAGHASGSWLAFQDEDGAPMKAGAEGLAAFLGRQEGLVLVFLNGCSTIDQVRRLREGVPAVVATSDAIDDAAAAEFAGRFYAGLRTKPLERAFADAEDFMKSLAQGDPRGVTRELELEREDERTQWPWLLDCDDEYRDWRLGGASAVPPEIEAVPSVVPATPRRRRAVLASAAGGLSIAALGIGWWVTIREDVPPETAAIGEEPTKPASPAIEMTLVPGGRACSDDRDPTGCTKVEVPPFCIGTTELTQGQWKQLHDGVNPSWTLAGIGDDLPVNNITWQQALEAANRLSRREQRSVCYVETDAGWSRGDAPCDGYRLPTDFEWQRLMDEHGPVSCASSNVADVSLFDDALEIVEHYEPHMSGPSPAGCQGRIEGDGHARLAPVGSMKPGSFGINDLQGNVAEWIWSSTASDGADFRGHSFAWPGLYDEDRFMGAFRRMMSSLDWRDGAVGLRMARSLPQGSVDCGS